MAVKQTDASFKQTWACCRGPVSCHFSCRRPGVDVRVVTGAFVWSDLDAWGALFDWSTTNVSSGFAFYLGFCFISSWISIFVHFNRSQYFPCFRCVWEHKSRKKSNIESNHDAIVCVTVLYLFSFFAVPLEPMLLPLIIKLNRLWWVFILPLIIYASLLNEKLRNEFNVESVYM